MATTHTIDAEGKTFGRIASAAAKALMGKTSPDYVANQVADVRVYITNAGKTKMSERRMKETLHERYSGYPGRVGKVCMNWQSMACFQITNFVHL